MKKKTVEYRKLKRIQKSCYKLGICFIPIYYLSDYSDYDMFLMLVNGEINIYVYLYSRKKQLKI